MQGHRWSGDGGGQHGREPSTPPLGAGPQIPHPQGRQWIPIFLLIVSSSPSLSFFVGQIWRADALGLLLVAD
jgi:hypothetical protein